MSDDEDDDVFSAFDEFGDAFEQTEDPLKEFDSTLKGLPDPIIIYKERVIANKNISEKRRVEKDRFIDRWKEYMEENYERHPACPNAQHVSSYITELLAEDYVRSYFNSHLRVLENMFEFWANHPSMPHGQGSAHGYNPITAAKTLREDEIRQLTASKKKSEHQISVEELGHRIRNIKNILHTSVIVTQLKYGLRGGGLCHLRISDVKIDHPDIKDLYPDLGTHQRIKDKNENVVYLASRYERPGVKSEEPAVIPIDRELTRLLIRYLQQRPPVNEPWLFVNNATGGQLNTAYLTRTMWKPAFHPEYSETEQFESVRSHYARHRFSTYWKKEVDINRSYLKYMRGDSQNSDSESTKNSDALDQYIHTYYKDIKDIYLNHIYTFGV